VAPLLGDGRAATLREAIARLDQIEDVGELTEMCVR
jgi:hypothetical protein